MSGLNIIIVAAATAGLSAAFYYLSPKGDNQTYVSLSLTLPLRHSRSPFSCLPE